MLGFLSSSGNDRVSAQGSANLCGQHASSHMKHTDRWTDGRADNVRDIYLEFLSACNCEALALQHRKIS